MGIQPPSDLILDVINAADPAKAQAMATRLRQAAGTSPAALGFAGDAFTDELKQAGMGIPLEQMSLLSTSSSVSLHNATALSGRNGGSNASDAYRRFESMVLSNFVETMLPSKSATIYGKGTAGEVWRSMLAERMADEVAKAGGIGLADRMYTNAVRNGTVTEKPAADTHTAPAATPLKPASAKGARTS